MRSINNNIAVNTVIKPSFLSVFEMSAEELTETIRPTAEKLTKEAWDKGSYIVYFDKNLCPAADIMVHEYRDHKELVRILGVGKTQLVKIL
jgi:hypothetical protein